VCAGYIPKIYQNQYVLAGISFSEKSGIYLLAAQLLFSDGLESIVAGLIALSFGLIYSQNLVRVQRFRLPAFIEVGHYVCDASKDSCLQLLLS
jgi:hypothetical protein